MVFDNANNALTDIAAALLGDRILQTNDSSSTTTNSTTVPSNDQEESQKNSLFQIIYTCAVLFLMFLALVSDRVGADMVMIGSLTLFMAANIITIDEALAGFSNEGLLTVLTLFVVAEGISRTGALDWYMSKLLGRPTSTASAQLRLMVPIAFISAFLNNTPVVAVMIPIVQKWSKNIGKSAQQLLIPLSFASILGGTCTLIGTSTNLVVQGLLEQQYPDQTIGLFDLSIYGVPIAMAGILYVLLASPCLLPGGTGTSSCGGGVNRSALDISGNEAGQDLLLGAKLMPWSPAAGRSVKRSGLRDTGGIYLVSVHRATTGNVHRAVGQDFVLNVGDVLYFTGSVVEVFGEFCEEHGMEVLTNELQGGADISGEQTTSVIQQLQREELSTPFKVDRPLGTVENNTGESPLLSTQPLPIQLETVVEGIYDEYTDTERDASERPMVEVGLTKESLLQANETERSISITRMIDLIRGVAREEPTAEEDQYLHTKTQNRSRGRKCSHYDAHKVVVTSENGFVVVGVDARDRPGLLLDISKGLVQLNLNLRHSEASVVGNRSISIWRCELIEAELPDLEEIWSVINALLDSLGGNQVVKRRGMRVIRAVVTSMSSLNGRNINEVNFRDNYKCSIVALQQAGQNATLNDAVFGSGDVLILKANDDSPLLKPPPSDFYNRTTRTDGGMGGNISRNGSVNLFQKIKKRVSAATLNSKNSNDNLDAIDIGTKQFTKNQSDVSDLEVARNSAGNSDLNNSSEDSADIFYIGNSGNSVSDDSCEHNNELKIDNIEVGMNDIVSEEEIWKDLQVIFVDKEKQRSEEGGGREFLMAMEISGKGLADKTVSETGLDKLPGLFLVNIDRPTREDPNNAKSVPTKIMRGFRSNTSDVHSVDQNDDASGISSLPTINSVFKTISPAIPLKVGDFLWFAGDANAIGDLRKIPGLTSHEKEEVKKINEKVHDRRLVEAVLARRGPLVGKTVKQVRFRTRYGAAVIAVHRDGSRIHEHPGRIRLQGGDVLLLEAGPTFIKGSYDNDRAFSLLAEVKDSAPPRLKLLIPALLLTVAMLAVYTANVASLLVCALVASMCMLGLGILSEQEARNAVNWEVYLTIAAAFGIGTALVNSGVAGGIANFLVKIGTSFGEGSAGLFAAVYLATFLISNVVTNNAAAALIFPIAMDAATQANIDVILMSYCVMLGASASFMSPFGYTTNLMIYGPGGYKYNDFLRIGTPMQFVLWICTVALLVTTNGSNFYISWLVSFGVLLFVASVIICDFKALFQPNPNN